MAELPMTVSCPVELLAPARDLECGRAAIDHGADAVYVGAPRFGARSAVGNSLEDIGALVDHAHRYWARVYVTLNTLLTDRELPEARALAWDLAGVGVDGLILQDVGLLEGDLPPEVMLISSTQMHNISAARVRFWQEVGFQRAILARELSLGEIRAIRAAVPGIELECFVHGALCVCHSGQCTLSYALGGRSGNRGECAQPCRVPYSLEDSSGRVLAEDQHLLSLQDLDLSEHLGDLLDAGVTSFKIEGRLKNRAYVATVVAHYRALLDELLPARGLRRASSGTSAPEFAPDPRRVFQRGRTAYFLTEPAGTMATLRTPKSLGPAVGRVRQVRGRRVELLQEADVLDLHPGDGLVFFDPAGTLRGTRVNRAEGVAFEAETPEGLQPGTDLYRNHDQQYLSAAAGSTPRRTVAVSLTLTASLTGLELEAVDEDGVRVRVKREGAFEEARHREGALDTCERQLRKSGDTEFACGRPAVHGDPLPHVPVSTWNALRRETLEELRTARAERRPRPAARTAISTQSTFPAKELDFRGNVLNAAAAGFYRRHGVQRIEPAAESGLDLTDRVVMTTRYCVRRELGWCSGNRGGGAGSPPLFLVDPAGRRLELEFDCEECGMRVVLRR